MGPLDAHARDEDLKVTEQIKCTKAERLLIDGRHAAALELHKEASRLTAQGEALFSEAIAATLESHGIVIGDRTPRVIIQGDDMDISHFVDFCYIV